MANISEYVEIEISEDDESMYCPNGNDYCSLTPGGSGEYLCRECEIDAEFDRQTDIADAIRKGEWWD